MGAMFDVLRAKVEVEVSHPGVVAITSATNEDGREVTARSLAESLAVAGYSTLLIDVLSESTSAQGPAQGFTLEEIGRWVMLSESTSTLVAVNVVESGQRATNQRRIRAAFEVFRQKFDYTVISAGFQGPPDPFVRNVLSVVNAVLVTVRTGRRQARDDERLAADLKRLGPRFLGLVPITKATTETGAEPRAPLAPIEETIGRPERAQWTAYAILLLAWGVHRLRAQRTQIQQSLGEGGH